jgi:hypothetical protein
MREEIDRPAADDRRTRLQYSLRAMFLAVTLLAGLCGLIISVSPLWTVMIVWFIVLVAGHVLGNWLGTHLRRKAPVAREEHPPGRPVRYAPASRLRHHVTLGRSMFVSTAISAVAGCVLGLFYLAQRSAQVTISGLIVGGLSAAVIGGVFGF